MELPLGALCAACEQAIERRAARAARLVGAATTALLALYLWIRLPESPLDVQRLVAVLGIVVWYGVTVLVVKRLVREYLR